MRIVENLKIGFSEDLKKIKLMFFGVSNRICCCRLFACMNPATDTSKRRLPEGIRSKFIEYYVNENDDASDLAKIVSIIILLIEST